MVDLDWRHRHADGLQDRLGLADVGHDAGFIQVVEDGNRRRQLAGQVDHRANDHVGLTAARITASFFDGVSIMIMAMPSLDANSMISASFSGRPSNTVGFLLPRKVPPQRCAGLGVEIDQQDRLAGRRKDRVGGTVWYLDCELAEGYVGLAPVCAPEALPKPATIAKGTPTAH